MDSLYKKDNMLWMFCQKINWLADNSEYEVYLVLTDGGMGLGRYELSPRVKIVNLDINYDELKGMNVFGRILLKKKKLYQYRGRLKKFLCKIRPMATVSSMGQELHFLSYIDDGSLKIYEVHYDKRSRTKFLRNSFLVKAYRTYDWMRFSFLFLTMKRRDVLVADSESMRQKWDKGFKRVMMIPNPLKEYPPVRGQQESKKVMAIGDYKPEKGFEHLIDMWERLVRRYPDWRLHLYGDGDQTRYREMIKTKHMGKAIQCYERPDEPFEIYPKYALFVQAYEFDKYGRHLMEAMAHSIPCVAYNVPYGPKDLIRDEENGFLVKPNCLMDLSLKVGLLIRNTELRERMGKQAHADVCKYELGEVMREWIKLYESISYNKKGYFLPPKEQPSR